MTLYLLVEQMLRAREQNNIRLFEARRARVLRVAGLLDAALATSNHVRCGMLLTEAELQIAKVRFSHPRRKKA